MAYLSGRERRDSELSRPLNQVLSCYLGYMGLGVPRNLLGQINQVLGPEITDR
jgi:hypothetical protein